MCHCVKPDQVMRNASRKGSFWSDIESKLCEPVKNVGSPEKACNHDRGEISCMYMDNNYKTLRN